MTIKDIVPWKWGGLRRGLSEVWEPDTFRRQMDALHKEIDRVFDDLAFSRAEGPWLSKMWERENVMPGIDETEDEKAFYVSIELPGMDEEDVDVTLSGRQLKIRGEKKQESEQKDKEYYRRERSYGAFRRSIELPGEVDAANIEASFKKGVLLVTLPKTKEAQEKIKHIDIKAA